MYNTSQVIDFSKDGEFWTSKKDDMECGYYEQFKKYIKT